MFLRNVEFLQEQHGVTSKKAAFFNLMLIFGNIAAMALSKHYHHEEWCRLGCYAVWLL
jgi:hypothetical protein